MSEHIFMKKRQRRRKAATSGFTTKHIIMLVLLSLVAYVAFRLWVGNPMASLCGDDCESMYSLLGYVLGFFLLFAGIVFAGATVGVLVALVRKHRAKTETDFAAQFLANVEENTAETGDATETPLKD